MPASGHPELHRAGRSRRSQRRCRGSCAISPASCALSRPEPPSLPVPWQAFRTGKAGRIPHKASPGGQKGRARYPWHRVRDVHSARGHQERRGEARSPRVTVDTGSGRGELKATLAIHAWARRARPGDRIGGSAPQTLPCFSNPLSGSCYTLCKPCQRP